MLCHVELCEDDGTEVDASADWTKAISRGGIKLVNNKNYHLFHAVETLPQMKICSFIGASYQPSGRRKKSRSCYGCLYVDLWVTVHGFSFAKSMLEMYKQAQKFTSL